jgi:hypothetical protein
MKVTLISTFSPKHYNVYGKYFVNSLEKYISNDINVLLYTDVPMDFKRKNFSNKLLEVASPSLTEFKLRNGHREIPNKTKGWIKDAVRFSHKSYAIIHASRFVKTDLLVWLDADTEVINNINSKYLQETLEDGNFVSYLGRPNRYTETGYLAFDMRNPHAKDFFDRWEWYYNTDEIYNLSGQLDCHVFDAVREEFETAGKITGQSISPPNTGAGHFDKRFKGYMAHYKGDKKEDRDSHYQVAIRKAGNK